MDKEQQQKLKYILSVGKKPTLPKPRQLWSRNKQSTTSSQSVKDFNQLIKNFNKGKV